MFLSTGYETYRYWRQRCLESLPLPHVTIFLDAAPQVCHDRIHMRARVSVYMYSNEVVALINALLHSVHKTTTLQLQRSPVDLSNNAYHIKNFITQLNFSLK